MGTKTKVIGIRVDQDVDERLLRFEAETGIERVTLARNALMAALSFYEKNQVITFPLRVVERMETGKEVPPDAERMAQLRPQDRGTPVLGAEKGKPKSESVS